MASHESQDERTSLSNERRVIVRRSKSLVPPSIVELGRNSVLLSWRATLGQCSIRTDNPEECTDSQEWDNLAEANERHRLRQQHGVNHGSQARSEASRVDVFEVDRVELQTCCGCPRCVYGQEEGQQREEDTCVEGRAYVCLCCSHARRGLGCWRSVYQGPDSRCRVNLSHGNALHYFRVLVRARLPSPDMRGFMRPQRAKFLGAALTTSRVFEQSKNRGMFSGRAPPDRLSPNRRTRRRESGYYPGVAIVNSSDQDEEIYPVCSPTAAPDCPRVTAGGVGAFPGSPSRGGGGIGGSPTTCHNDPKAFGAGEDVVWFGSDPVFVDSCPPPVTLHGIGTALVLTWPALSGFSGEERVSYILEQRAHAQTPPTPSTRWSNFQLDHRCSGELGGLPQSRRRQHNRRPDQEPPKHADAKEFFSVGTRCWFMPNGLKVAMRYWYRLRLGHEGGKSVGGPWVSHMTSITPPRCIHVECRALLLSLPRAIDDGVCSGRRDDGREQGVLKSCEQLQTECAKQLSAANTERDHSNSQHLGGRPGEGSDSDVEGAGKVQTTQRRKSDGCQKAAPMIWYTLEGLDKGARWIVLYRGSASEVMVKGLQPNTRVKFRVGIDVDITELRHRSLRPLAFLELEPPPPIIASPTNDSESAAASSGWLSHIQTPPSEKNSSPSCSSFVRPALRLKAAAASRTLIRNRPSGQRRAGTEDGRLERRRQSPSPATSPTVSQMKQQGFRFHDLAATVGGGFYPERPLLSWSRLQGHRDGAVWEFCARDGGSEGSEPQYREVSAVGEFSTASLPPRFAAFVVCGILQVKLWWTKPPCDPYHTGVVPSCRIRPATAHPATAPPSTAFTTASHRENHRPTPSGVLGSLPPFQDRPSTAAEAARRPEVGVAASYGTGAPPSIQQNPSFTLNALVPAVDGRDATWRSVYSGPRLWADLSRSPPPSSESGADILPVLAPSTAYCVRLSRKTGVSQPESVVEGVVVTAPPAPGIELAAVAETAVSPAAAAGEGVGEVVLKAVWRTGIDESFLPDGFGPLEWSIALEMAQACEAGPAAGGVGGTATKIAQLLPSEQRAPQAASLRGTATSVAAIDLRTDAASQNTMRTSSVSLEGPVRQDADMGQCWTLNSSSWGKPRKRTEGFRVVWSGGGAAVAEGGLVEAPIPALAPGMRFAFRIRLECRFGVAVSAATVYQTALVAPVSPKGLRACLTTHESRAGNTSKCVRLLWDSFHPGHGKNVVTSFIVQARRPRNHSGDQPPRGANHPHPPPILGHSWQDVCTCTEIGCLDPATLGVAHIAADYRVRAEGPGGKGPWCEPVRVDLHVPDDDSNDNFGVASEWSGGGGDASGVVSSLTFAAKEDTANNERRPMGFVRPGARARDSLTGEARRLWTKQRPLRVSPPPAVVATLVLQGAEVTARTIAAAEHRHRRAGGSKQLLWGALASPRAARGCRVEAASKSTAAVPGNSGVRASNDSEGGGAGAMPGDGDTRQNGRWTRPVDEPGARVEAEVVPVPHQLEQILRDQLDVSCCLGRDAASQSDSGVREGGLRDAGAVVRGSRAPRAGFDTQGPFGKLPEYPVVPWIVPTPLPNLHGGGGRTKQGRQLGRHNRDHQCRRRRRLRRRQDTAAAADHGVRTTISKDELSGQALSALTPQQQRQRRRRQHADKSPLRSPRYPRPGRRLAANQFSAPATAGNLDCYREPNSSRLCGGFKSRDREVE